MAGLKQYHTVAIGLHWAIAGLILIAFGLGLTVDRFPKRWETGIINTHALLGLLALCLSFLRIGWRLTHRVPDLPQRIGAIARVGAAAGHAALYILMILVPVIGIPSLLYRGRGLDLMIFQIASPFERTPAVYHPLTEYHEIAAFALIALAADMSLQLFSISSSAATVCCFVCCRKAPFRRDERGRIEGAAVTSERDERRAGHPSH